MSWSKSVTLWCDAETCGRHTGNIPKGQVRRARRYAADKMGWTFDRDTREDYCPDHA